MMIPAVLIIIPVICHATDQSMDNEWLNFKTKFNKNYQNQSEDTRRQTIWKDNLDLIKKHNQEAKTGQHSYTMGMNQFGDMTIEEFQQYARKGRGNNKRPCLNCPVRQATGKTGLPSNVDWREKRYVTAVKDQGLCFSSWAFTAAATLEGQLAKTTNQLINLSAQQLIDCSTDYGNNGCFGGWKSDALLYVSHNGITNDKAYPYNGSIFSNSSCKANGKPVEETCSSFLTIKSGDEPALKEAVADVGPIGVAIPLTLQFIFYQSGIFDTDECNGKNGIRYLDQSMTVVGYGLEAERFGQKAYWIVKNSWGTFWGEKGYIRMIRYKDNQCGIANDAVYPIDGPICEQPPTPTNGQPQTSISATFLYILLAIQIILYM